MPTYIELYLLSYLLVNFFMFMSCMVLLKKHTKVVWLVLASLLLSIMKLLMDIFFAPIYLQIAVIFLCTASLMIILFKVNHICRLWPFIALILVYYSGIFALQTVLSVILSSKLINYISNYYLLCQLGFSFITFAFILIFDEYKHLSKQENFIKNCVLQIDGKQIKLVGFVDTGNKLVDGKSKLGVVIVNFQSIKRYLSKKSYADIILSTNSSKTFEDMRKLKCTTMGGTNYLTIFKPEQFFVETKQIDCMIGIAINSQIDDYDALLNASCL